MGYKETVENLKKNKFYGCGKSSSDKWWKDLIDKMIEVEYIETCPIAQLIYVPKVTQNGINFLNDYKYDPKLDTNDLDLY